MDTHRLDPTTTHLDFQDRSRTLGAKVSAQTQAGRLLTAWSEKAVQTLVTVLQEVHSALQPLDLQVLVCLTTAATATKA
jgi:hypothetical protein